MTGSFSIAMLAFPGMTQLDFTAPYEIFSKLPGAKVHIVWKALGEVRSECGLTLLADTALDDCPPCDILFVPGGPGQIDLMSDDAVLAFLRQQSSTAQWITSVCTGSLLLGAAGLLKGYRATCHWLSHPQLTLFGATPVEARVVVDRNRVTGGGVTSGLDFALELAKQVAGEHVARRLQLILEYDPQPPFDSGSPARANVALVDEVRQRTKPMIEHRMNVSQLAAARLMDG